MVKMTVGVKGMMCAMCESHVAGAVRDKFEVEKVKADKGKENCVVIAAREIPETELRAAIDARDMKPPLISQSLMRKRDSSRNSSADRFFFLFS